MKEFLAEIKIGSNFLDDFIILQKCYENLRDLENIFQNIAKCHENILRPTFMSIIRAWDTLVNPFHVTNPNLFL